MTKSTPNASRKSPKTTTQSETPSSKRPHSMTVPRHVAPDGGAAFLPDPRVSGRSHTKDDLAESLAEGFVSSATSAEESGQSTRDELLAEEVGGPFLEEADGREEFANTVDATNPADGDREAFPTAMGSGD